MTFTPDKAMDQLIEDFKRSNKFPAFDCFASDTYDEEKPPEELLKAVEEHEDKTPIIEDTKTINLGAEEEPREIQIGLSLTPEEQDALTKLLQEYTDVFAWSYKDMPGIDREIAEHKIDRKSVV